MTIHAPRTATLAMCLLLLVSMAACDLSDVPIDVDPAEPQLVVSSIVGPGNTLLVTVTRSFSALSATDVDSLDADFLNRLLVDSARVTLSTAGTVETLDPLFDIRGVYSTQLGGPVAGEPMEISIIDPRSGESVFATTQFMPPVAIDSASISEEISSGGEPTTVLYYRFTDLPGDSFYALYAYSASGVLDPDSLTGQELGEEVDVFYQNLLTDRAIEGSTVEETVRIPFYSADENVVVSLAHISEGYYRFLQARRRVGGVLSSLANEPVNVPTNVEGGLGYFSAHRPTAIVVDRSE